jgi:hypothetical protein
MAIERIGPFLLSSDPDLAGDAFAATEATLDVLIVRHHTVTIPDFFLCGDPAVNRVAGVRVDRTNDLPVGLVILYGIDAFGPREGGEGP